MPKKWRLTEIVYGDDLRTRYISFTLDALKLEHQKAAARSISQLEKDGLIQGAGSTSSQTTPSQTSAPTVPLDARDVKDEGTNCIFFVGALHIISNSNRKCYKRFIVLFHEAF